VAQDYLTQQYTLPAPTGQTYSSTHSIAQDCEGYLWVETSEGLARYDGQDFKVYSIYNKQLQAAKIYHVWGLSDCTLWILQRNRIGGRVYIDVLDLNTMKLSPLDSLLSSPFDYDLSTFNTDFFEEEKDGSVLFHDEHKIYAYKDQEINVIANFNSDTYIQSFQQTPKGNLWCLINKNNETTSLQYRDLKENILEEEILPFGISNSTRSFCLHTLEDETLYYIVKQKNKIHNFQKKIGHSRKQFFLSTKREYDYQIYASYYKQIWAVGKQEYIDCFDLNGQFLHRAKMPKGFNSSPFRTPFFDTQGGFWSLNIAGLSRLQLKKNRFKNYLTKSIDTDSILRTNYGCRALAKNTSGQLFINTTKGTYYYSNDNKFQAPIDISSIHEGVLMTNSKLGLLVEGNLVWITDERRLLICWNSDSKTSKTYSYPIQKSEVKLHWWIHRDRNKKLWLGHHQGLSFLNEQTQELNLHNNYGNYESLNRSSVFYIHENNQGLWIASTSGLYLMNWDGSIKAHYGESSKNKDHYLPASIFTHIYEDRSGVFWLSTKNAGLIKWDRKKNIYQQFTEAEGLSNNTIYAVYEDDNAQLWMSSNNGITQMDKFSFKVVLYSTYEGLPHLEFNTTSHYKDSSGRIYFGSLTGLTSFDPNDFEQTKKSDIPLKIKSIEIYNSKVGEFQDFTQEFLTKNKITLPSNTTLAEVSFSYLDLQNPDFVQYAYKIEGFQDSWQEVFPAKFSLGGIPYGFYTIHMKAMGTDKNWSKPISIPLYISPPFYLNLAFLLTLLICFSLFTWGIIRWRTQQLRKRQLELEHTVSERTSQLEKQAYQLKELDRLKSQFFTNVSHELRTPLTLILGPLSYIIDRPDSLTEDVYKQLFTMQRNGKKLLQLIEEILDLSKIEVGKLALFEEPIHLKSFLLDIYARFEAQAQIRTISFIFNQNFESNTMLVFDQNKVEKIINNLLSNAFKFTSKGGTISLDVFIQNKLLSILVKDTGKGIHLEDKQHIFERFYQSAHLDKNAKGGTGIGLALCQDYIKLMNGTIEVNSTLGQGSLFTVQLPLQKASMTVEQVPVSIQLPYQEAILPPLNKEQKETSSQSILLVEDNPDMIQFIQSLLEKKYTIYTAENGQIALNWLSEQSVQPDLILSDIMMPEMDGFELLKQLKNHLTYQYIPIIMLTAQANERYKLNALRIGVDDYLTKPFSTTELEVRISNILNNATLRKSYKNESFEEIIKEDSPTIEVLPERDQEWLERLEKNLHTKVIEPLFGPDDLVTMSAMSKRNFYRKIKTVVGLTPGQYIKELRMQIARDILEKGSYHTMSEVCYAAGFSTPSYFSKEYEKRFGKKAASYF
jgi:signal transduction histidine kinase/CheY-like chemotaxis protein/AraC-like DNA-binding protein